MRQPIGMETVGTDLLAVDELTEPLLNYWAAKCAFSNVDRYHPTTDWVAAGDLLETYGMELASIRRDTNIVYAWEARASFDSMDSHGRAHPMKTVTGQGATRRIAIVRCFIKLMKGDYVPRRLEKDEDV